MNINIEWLSDDSDCDTCGSNWAEGAKVTNADTGELILHLQPAASCFGGDHWGDAEVYKLLLEKLGYNLIDDRNN